MWMSYMKDSKLKVLDFKTTTFMERSRKWKQI